MPLAHWSCPEIACRPVRPGLVASIAATTVSYWLAVEKVIIPKALRPGVHIIALTMDNSTVYAPKQLEAWLQAQIEDLPMAADDSGLLAVAQRLLAQPDRNLFQHYAVETVATQSFHQPGSAARSH